MIQNFQIKSVDHPDHKHKMSGEDREGWLLKKKVAKGSIPSSECLLSSHTPLGLFPASILVPSAVVVIPVSITDRSSFTLETCNHTVKYFYLKKTQTLFLLKEINKVN